MQFTRVAVSAGLMLAIAGCVADDRPAGNAAKSAPAASTGANRAFGGQKIAQAKCAACHEIVPGVTVDKSKTGPGFAAIGVRPEINGPELDRLMRERHVIVVKGKPSTMPAFELKPHEREQVVDYILSFRSVGAYNPAPQLNRFEIVPPNQGSPVNPRPENYPDLAH